MSCHGFRRAFDDSVQTINTGFKNGRIDLALGLRSKHPRPPGGNEVVEAQGSSPKQDAKKHPPDQSLARKLPSTFVSGGKGCLSLCWFEAVSRCGVASF